MNRLQRYFRVATPEEMVREVHTFVNELGLPPERSLIVLFNSGLLGTVVTLGVDRTGVPELDQWSMDNAGIESLLESKGLGRNDGLYAHHPAHWTPESVSLFFERGVFNIASHRVGVAIYDRNALENLLSPSPNPEEGEGGYYYFRDPRRKLEALKGILLQRPTQLDLRFHALPLPRQRELLQNLVLIMTRENAEELDELTKDLSREVTYQLLYKVRSRRRRQELESYQGAIEALRASCKSRINEFMIVDAVQRDIERLRQAGKGSVPGTTIRLTIEFIAGELRNQISPAYKEELLELLMEAGGLTNLPD